VLRRFGRSASGSVPVRRCVLTARATLQFGDPRQRRPRREEESRVDRSVGPAHR
jgi:hypothetical protein